MEGTRKGTASNSSDLWFLSSGYTGDDAAGLDNEWTALGFVGRLSYNFLDRYLFRLIFVPMPLLSFPKTNVGDISLPYPWDGNLLPNRLCKIKTGFRLVSYDLDGDS